VARWNESNIDAGEFGTRLEPGQALVAARAARGTQHRCRRGESRAEALPAPHSSRFSGAGAAALAAHDARCGTADPFSDNDGAGAVETLAAMTHVAFPGPKLLVLALATYWQLHSDVQPFHVELVSLTTLQVTTPQLVPLVQGLAGLPAAPRSQA
jgi:hypothetical protein